MVEENQVNKTIELTVNMDFDQNIDVLVSELSEILKNKKTHIYNREIKDKTVIECIYQDQIREFKDLMLVLSFNYTKDKFENLKISLEHHQINENDLELYIYKNICSKLLDIVYKDTSSKYTVRIYKTIFNKSTIKGFYSINWINKIQMFSLMDFEKDESFSEHIIAFDVEVRANNLDKARSIAYNIILDFTNFLSVLIDVGFQDIRSKYMNFLIKDPMRGIQACRYRTGAYDVELGLYIKDNFFGINSEDDPQDLYGPIHLFTEDLNVRATYQLKNDKFLEKKFKDREMQKKSSMKNEYLEGMFTQVHNPYHPIRVPKNIREYFREIKQLKDDDMNKYECFRNASRLYALAKNVEQFNETSAVSYMVSSVEAIGKSEGLSFSQVCKKYLNGDVDFKFLEYLYGNVRSGHFHAGEFAFLEYDVKFNRSMDNLYTKILKKNHQAKKILREVLINWIQENLNMKNN
jgi:hypothetical protein